MKDTKQKIEFWLHKNQKAQLKKLSEQTGHTLSELVRRAIEKYLTETK